MLELNLGLRRPLSWQFIVAAVKRPILGADFLRQHNLLVDLRAKKLIDKKTGLTINGCIANSAATPTVLTINLTDPYHNLLQEYAEITSPNFNNMKNSGVEHHIVTHGPPVYCKVRPLPPHKYQAAKKEFQTMLEQGICRPSKSPWASPLHLVEKKTGEYRPCGDYRRLNAVTKPDRYPIPRLRDFTYHLEGMKIFSKIDLKKAYNQLRIREEDIEKTAVITPFGLFEFPRMCFGLCNSGQTFQRHINNVLGNMDHIFPFVDDILVASPDQETHRSHLKELFKRLKEHGLRINVSKCVFGHKKLEFLGYLISEAGIQPTEDRVKTISHYPEPTTVQELRRFLGILNFYKENIPHAAHVQQKLYKYLRSCKKNDKTKVNFNKEDIEAFQACKNSIKNAVTLSHPSVHAPLSLMCDASNTCVGAALQQRVGNSWRPLGFHSKKLTEAQQGYSTYDRELLAIYLAIRHFRRMFEGKEINVYTDHKPLTQALLRLNSKTETPLRTRYLHYISQFTLKIRHIEGKDNIVADALSRIEAISTPSPIDYDELIRLQHSDQQLTDITKNKILRFEWIRPLSSSRSILCETSSGRARPYLPSQLRRKAFDAIHELSHPGTRATRKMITQRFFWPSMNKDTSLWTKCCITCQRTKVQRHTVSPLEQFPPAERLMHIHIDIIGPLPISDGKRYCVTIVDRATKWPEAFPVRDMEANTIATVIYEGWIVRFGCPERITSDQGRQFESHLFKTLMNRMGIEKTRTTAYHPQANGMVERWHRSLKTALTARLHNSSWTQELPTVLLGLRAAIKDNTNVSSAEALYGKTLRLPGEMCGETSTYANTNTHFSDVITNAIKKMQAVRRSTDRRAMFIHDDLKVCTHVFIRTDAYRRPLTPTYEGPYRVLKRHNKVYTVKINDRQVNISIDRLKPAFIPNTEEAVEPINDQTPYITRSGRTSRPTVRFAL